MIYLFLLFMVDMEFFLIRSMSWRMILHDPNEKLFYYKITAEMWIIFISLAELTSNFTADLKMIW